MGSKNRTRRATGGPLRPEHEAAMSRVRPGTTVLYGWSLLGLFVYIWSVGTRGAVPEAVRSFDLFVSFYYISMIIIFFSSVGFVVGPLLVKPARTTRPEHASIEATPDS